MSFKKTIILALDTAEFNKGAEIAKGKTEDLKDSMEGLSDTTEDLSGNMDEVSGSTDSLVSQLTKAGTQLTASIAAFTGLKAALVDCISTTSEFGERLTTLSAETGLSAEELQMLDYAAGQLNINSDTLMNSLTGMASTMAKARDGSTELQTAFRELGVRVTEHGNKLRNSQEVYLEVINALGEVENETERAALATTIFGLSAEQLNPLIQSGTGALSAYAKQASEMGLIVSNQAVAAGNEFSNSLETLNKKLDVVKMNIGTGFLPVIQNILTLLASIPTEVYTIIAVLATMFASFWAAKQAVSGIQGIVKTLADISSGASFATTQIIVLVATLAALAAAIAVIIGYGNTLNQTFSSLSGVTNATKYNASGTNFFPGGQTWVGEQGPELVTLPTGSRIQSASNSAGGSTNIFNVTLDAKNVKDWQNIVDLMQNEQTSYRVGRVRV